MGADFGTKYTLHLLMANFFSEGMCYPPRDMDIKSQWDAIRCREAGGANTCPTYTN